MKETITINKKRTRRDYNLAFKLAVIDQVEKGEMTYRQAKTTYDIQGTSTVLVWLRKHGQLGWSRPQFRQISMPKAKETPAQKIKRLEKELANEQLKNEILNTMIDLSDQEDGTSIRKKYSRAPSDDCKKKSK